MRPKQTTIDERFADAVELRGIGDGDLLTRPAVARRCGVGVGTVQAWIDSSELPAVNLAADTLRKPRWFVSVQALEAFFRGRARTPANPGPMPKRQRRDRRDPNSMPFRHRATPVRRRRIARPARGSEVAKKSRDVGRP